MTRGRTELGDVTVHNIKQLKRINQVVFPVSYNDKFYKDVLEVGDLAKLAYFNDIVVGAVCCREDRGGHGDRRLYIMTLGCLAPYRRLGIGTVMLRHVLEICSRDGHYDNVFLHVQVNNDSALKFYEHFGFEIVERKQNYYKRIEPADAFVLQKTFRAVTSARGALTSAGSATSARPGGGDVTSPAAAQEGEVTSQNGEHTDHCCSDL